MIDRQAGHDAVTGVEDHVGLVVQRLDVAKALLKPTHSAVFGLNVNITDVGDAKHALAASSGGGGGGGST